MWLIAHIKQLSNISEDFKIYVFWIGLLTCRLQHKPTDTMNCITVTSMHCCPWLARKGESRMFTSTHQQQPAWSGVLCCQLSSPPCRSSYQCSYVWRWWLLALGCRHLRSLNHQRQWCHCCPSTRWWVWGCH